MSAGISPKKNLTKVAENQATAETADKSMPWPTRLAAGFLLIFCSLIPMKFGSMVLPITGGMFQADGWGWALNAWPSSLFMLLAAISLLLLTLACPIPVLNNSSGRYVLLFIVLGIFSLAGLLEATQLAYGVQFLVYLTGLLCYLLSIKIFLVQVNQARYWLIGAWSVGILLAVALAYQQYFWGFDALEQYIAEQREAGAQISGVIAAKNADRRTHLPFDLPNSLAGFLLLALPVLLIGVQRFAKRFEPEKYSKIFLMSVAGLGVIGVFFTTRSRAAFLALVLTLVVAGVFYLKSVKLRLLAGILAVIVIAGGSLYVKESGRGFGSMTVRFDYAKVALEMVDSMPLSGRGWGEFHYYYMMNKSNTSEEAPQATHNIVLDFAAQSGVLAGVAVILLMLYPFIHLLVRRRWNWESILLAAGLLAFEIHSLADVNLQVPSSMALMLTVSMLILNFKEEVVRGKRRWFWTLAVLPMVALCGWNFIGDYHFDQLLELPAKESYLLPSKLAACVKYKPFSAYPHNFAARRYFAMQNFATAQAEVEKAKRLAPLDPEPWITQLEIDLVQNKFAEAEETVTQLRKLFPQNWLFLGTPQEVSAQIRKSRGN